MRKSKLLILLLSCLTIAYANAEELLIQRGDITVTDEDIDAALTQFSAHERWMLRQNKKSIFNIIEDVFANKVAYADQAENILSQPLLKKASEQLVNRFVYHNYVRQQQLEKAKDVDFEALAKLDWETNQEQFMTEKSYDVYHILFPYMKNVSLELPALKEKADALYKDIESGKISFADAAKAQVTPLSGTDDEGKISAITKNKLIPELEQVVFSLKKGEYTPVLETTYGYHIFQVIDIHEPKVKAFSGELKETLVSKAKEKYTTNVLRTIRSQYNSNKDAVVNGDKLTDYIEKFLKGND